MEWVETTGKTVDEARERALDELGVAEDDAEFETVEESQTGLFGKVRREARVRARVRPVQPRPKAERRERRRRKGGNGGSDGSGGQRKGRSGRSSGASGSAESTDDDSAAVPSGESTDGADAPVPADGQGGGTEREPRPRRSKKKSDPTPARSTAPADTRGSRTGDRSRGDEMPTPMTLDEQAEQMTDFLEGLLDAFGYEATVVREDIDEETIELAIDGDDLGLMIGPKGQTLTSIQELARVASTRDAGFPTDGRVRIDVGGYRQRRREALERFTTKVADEVLASGMQKVLEPMSPPDRKVVHDTVNGIDGVRTFSEGEDSGRRVVIAPE